MTGQDGEPYVWGAEGWQCGLGAIQPGLLQAGVWEDRRPGEGMISGVEVVRRFRG